MAGSVQAANRILAAAEVAAVNSRNRKDRTDGEIISDLIRAIGEARTEIENAREHIGRALE